MPINPLIASGGTPFDVSNALFQLGQGQRQDRAVSVAEERNALVDRRWQAQDEREQNALAKEAEREAQIDGLLGQFDESLAAKNYEAAAAIRRQVARLDPAFSKELDQYIPATEEELKFIKTPWGGQIGTLGGKKVTEWNPPQPQQYGPATYSQVTVMEDGKPVVYSVNTRNPNQRVRIGEGVTNNQPKTDEKAGQNQQAWGSFQQAMGALKTARSNTKTGPIAGLFPALTPEAQIAEAGVSALAPILKQIFRSAGEGTFTDKDQETLLAMIPTRRVGPLAEKAIMDNVTSIVAAKLGVEWSPDDEAQPSASGELEPGVVEDGYMYIGGPKDSPKSWVKTRKDNYPK